MKKSEYFSAQRAPFLAFAALSAAWVLTACSDSSPSSPTPPTVPAPTLQSVSVEGADMVEEGMQSQLTVTATYSDGRSQDVTSQSTYQSSDESIAVVSSSGLVTAVRPGSAEITASFAEGSSRREGSKTVTVARELPEFAVSFSVRSIRIIRDCDPGPIIQTGPGEFTYSVTTTFPGDGGAVSLAERTSRINRNNGERITIGRSRSETIVGDTASVNIAYRLTEWDGNTADGNMNNRRNSRTHRLSGGQWTQTGSNTLRLGDGNCSADLEYTFSARRVN